MTYMSETYLGDGLYASWDGWQIRLRAPRENGDHWVGLEPNVFSALVEYQKQVTAPPKPNEAVVWESATDAPGHPVGDGMKRTQEIMERTLSEAEPQIRWLSRNPERDKGSTRPASTGEKK